MVRQYCGLIPIQCITSNWAPPFKKASNTIIYKFLLVLSREWMGMGGNGMIIDS